MVNLNHSLFSVSDLKKILLTLNKPIKKSLGQNYLINHQAAMTISEAVAKVSKTGKIVEIGAGLGHLTGVLLAKNFKVLAIETDALATQFLKERWASVFEDNLHVMHQDFLKEFRLPTEFQEELVLLGNLPYHIMTPILFKSFEDFRAQVTDLFFMMQKEVADRILATLGTRFSNKLSVLSRYHCSEISSVLNLGPKSFYPMPKVNSTVLHFKLRKKSLANNYFVFKAFVHNSFLYRRKQLKTALLLKNYLSLDEEILSLLIQKKADLFKKRAAELTLEDYLYLTQKYLEMKKN